ncbi:MAG: T9SS type A sorting domain-containing protein [Candidatus Latescibacteria bacterium]|nr:T9SS type A sorting domain-containing protein [Candidatus Latescibacterota bacterium]
MVYSRMFRLTFLLLLSACLCGAFAPLKAAEFTCANPALPPSVLGAAKQTSPSSSHRAGRLNVLVIFARFADEQDRPVPAFAQDLFNVDRPGSLSHFYRTMSSGQFQIQGTVLPRRYAAVQAAETYLASEPGQVGQYGRFVREILDQVDRDIELAQFDNDGPDGIANSGDDDGSVDYLFINLQSTPSGFLLGNGTGIAGLDFADGGPYITHDRTGNQTPIQIRGSIERGAVQQEGTFAQTVGAMAHEFGHALGLPDLYDRSFLLEPDQDPGDDSAGIGRWGLMGLGALGWNGDDGPVPFCAWSLEQLGWLGQENNRLLEVRRDTTNLAIEPIHANGTVVKVPLRTLRPNHEEYLLLALRRRDATFYDRHIPGEGLLVWHIRPRHPSANDQELEKAVDLICADGLYQDAGYPLGKQPAPAQGRDNLDFWAHDQAYVQAHGGNQGDATDPFDGIGSTRLDLSSNPSVDPRGQLPAASTGLGLAVKRQGAAMQIDLHQPRWSGVIDGPVYWSGAILLEGDLYVAPQGSLFIDPGAQVWVSGSDHLQGGLDPELVEVEVQGSFRAAGYSKSDPPVVFQTRRPSQHWYGLRIEPATAARVEVAPGSLDLRHSEQGIVLIGAPDLPAHQRQYALSHRLDDGQGPGTMGNSDGQLAPAEVFQMDIELGNWSLTTYQLVLATLSWQSLLVYPVGDQNLHSQREIPFPGRVLFLPGTVRRYALPALALSPQTPVGTKIDFVADLLVQQDSDGVQARSDTLSFVVGESQPTAIMRLGAQPPDRYALESNYPNPFNGQTTIAYQVPRHTQVRLGIYNALGQPIRQLVETVQPAGHYQIAWDGRDDSGSPVGSGLYFYRFNTAQYQQIRRLLLITGLLQNAVSMH